MLETHATPERLLELSKPFLSEIRNLTAGTQTEQWLNERYGPGSPLYDEIARVITRGVEEGWAASIEVGGPKYRRSRLHAPDEASSYFSITCVYMDSSGNEQGNPEGSLRGDYHAHPYGEFNMVIPLDKGAALAGPNGWCHGGWTAPPPGSHHYPEAKGGAVIALFYLPAGRISYDVNPASASKS